LFVPATAVTDEAEPSSEPGPEVPEREAATAEERSVPYDDDETLVKTGVVKWWLPIYGHGVIIPHDGSPDIFFHHTCLNSPVQEGDAVYYMDALRKQATMVTNNPWYGCT
jgi:cold shock CspA family protein